MRKNFALALVAAALPLVAGFATGCSGDDDDATRSATTGTEGRPTPNASKRFPEFRVLYDTGFDYVDPALSYTLQGWGALWHVYLSLLGYNHAPGPDGATIVPVLAEDLPDVSSDGRTYKLKLREGLKYSDGEPVKASDFKYAIERLFRSESPGIGFFTDIEGAERFSRLPRPQMRRSQIEGIKADDEARTIEIELTRPRGDFQHILALSFAAPVPRGTPAGEQLSIPSTGPYRIATYQPLERLVLVRNQHFVPTPSVPATNPDRITATFTNDASSALESVRRGQADFNFHPFHRIAPALLSELQAEHRDRLRVFTPSNTYYFFMNTRTPPFDKREVRQAVNHALDRRELVRLYGGLATATENVLPPGYPGYRRHTLYPHDLAKARELIREAGAVGARVSVWGSNRDNVVPQVRYLSRVLNSIGLRADVRIIEANIYWSTIGDQRNKAQIGFAVWFPDYPHPLNYFDVLLNGERITPQNNDNYSNADVDSINDALEDLKEEPALSEGVLSKWADLDREVMEEALWAPFVNRRSIDFFADDIDVERCYLNHVLYQLDFGRICKKAAA